ncbi:hypothetical protein QAD02_022872 [Eretmocerus hayati]|uniref:Uncharacterized protein n=1 Tax=Eretmocerus hayati TaxID=131215 RepID=A0ACC2PVD3_9HYME|nr:hypothetical protein QAD02_022872 [Eretmocerus hayati]
MTCLFPDSENNVSWLKKKSQSHTAMGLKPWRSGTGHEESRSFLELSRENLNMQQQQQQRNNGGSTNSEADASINCGADYFTAELLQQQSPISSSSSSSLLLMIKRLRWLGLLTWAALGLALGCAIIELWTLRRILAHASDIASLGRDVEVLKQRLLERDLLDELRAFEQQLYASDGGGGGLGDENETSDENEQNSEQQLENGSIDEYDTGYEDETLFPSSTSPNFISNQEYHQQQQKYEQEALVATTTKTGSLSSPCSTSELEKVLATLRRLGKERGSELFRDRETEVEHEDGSWRERQKLLESEREKDRLRMAEEYSRLRDDAVSPSSSSYEDGDVRMRQKDQDRVVTTGLTVER